ncbi:MAG: prepilin-type N-terminal cleavage/methylation domain-containing protein [Gammaproteobacteria bacterium]
MTGHTVKHGGFTLIEVVFVIAILGLPASIAIPGFINLCEDAHPATARAVSCDLTAA